MLVKFDLLIETLRGLLHTQTTEQNNRDKLKADHPDLWSSPSTSAWSFCLIGCSFSALALHKVHLLSILLLAQTRLPIYCLRLRESTWRMPAFENNTRSRSSCLLLQSCVKKKTHCYTFVGLILSLIVMCFTLVLCISIAKNLLHTTHINILTN